ncbi:hypothetical protein [Bartonella sp. AS69XJJH]
MVQNLVAKYTKLAGKLQQATPLGWQATASYTAGKLQHFNNIAL